MHTDGHIQAIYECVVRVASIVVPCSFLTHKDEKIVYTIAKCLWLLPLTQAPVIRLLHKSPPSAFVVSLSTVYHHARLC